MPIVAVRTAAEVAARNRAQSALQYRTNIEVRHRVRRRPEQEAAPAEKSDKVGYKNPPKHSQFKKGVSGNAKGRPRGAKGLKTIAREKLSQKVVVKTAAGPKRMTRLDAMFLKMVELSFAGNIRAAQFCLQLYQSAVPDEPYRSSAPTDTIADMDAHDEAILGALHEALLMRGSDQ